MLFAYPGKNMKPLHSLREKNMLYGIQDFNIFRHLETKFKNLNDELRKKFEIKNLIKKIDGDISLGDYPDMDKYKKIRNEIIKEYIKNE